MLRQDGSKLEEENRMWTRLTSMWDLRMKEGTMGDSVHKLQRGRVNTIQNCLIGEEGQ